MLAADKALFPVLYSFRRCPFAMRARLALAVSGTVCELREVKLSAKPAAMLAASPKATVPVLVLPGGAVIDESLDVMRWALKQAGSTAWLATDGDPLIAENDGPFKFHLDRYKYPERHLSAPEVHRTAGINHLQALETRLQRHGQLGGETMTMVDAAIMPFVRQFAATDPEWFAAQPLPGVHRWLGGHLASALFASIMIRPAAWREGDAPVLFAQSPVA